MYQFLFNSSCAKAGVLTKYPGTSPAALGHILTNSVYCSITKKGKIVCQIGLAPVHMLF